MKKVSSFILITFMLCGMFCPSCTNDDAQKINVTDSKVYVVISDIHLGDQRSLTNNYSWNATMKDTLCLFLDYLKQHSNEWDELIVNGDFIDEWVVPIGKPTIADENDNPITEKEFFGKVVSANQNVFDKFRELTGLGKKLTYIPGNHDMNTTEEDFNTYLTGVFNQARESCSGLGHYSPTSHIFMEHGHRYDIFNAPYKGKDGIDGIPSGSIIPSGFFTTKFNTSSGGGSTAGSFTDEELQGYEALGDATYNTLWGMMANIIDQIATPLSHEQIPVVTNIDGMIKPYTWDAFATNNCTLFNGIVDGQTNGWSARCNYNGAVIVPSVAQSVLSGISEKYCDIIGLDVLKKSTARILVWGHSHAPIIKSVTDDSGKKCLYLNVGCWVDTKKVANASNTSSFGIVRLKSANEYVVSLHRFKVQDGQSIVEDVQKDSIKID
ncbi:MAG TPA: hypothetical protein DDY68_02930 [Porphyromonadaceae bacterium]|nr:hypothetical protein [Porphyromonadaceae bacterium]